MASLRKLLNRSLFEVVRSCARERGMCSKGIDEPVKFSSSKAATWKAEFSRRGADSKEDESPWYQTYVVTGSVAIFLVYFCVLREENDLDSKLNIPLYDRIEGLEEVQLRVALRYNLDNGLPTDEINARLEELTRGVKAN